MRSTLKTIKHAYIAPGALARGREAKLQSFRLLKVSVEQRTPLGKGKNCNALVSTQNELAQCNSLVPPGFEPIEDDVPLLQEAEAMQDTQRSEISSCESEKAKTMRGKTRYKNVSALKAGEKLRVTFYHNGVVGKHHATFARDLGMLVRDPNMCPLRVHPWADTEEDKLKCMWLAVTVRI
ncbi:PREDICTED: uncharacterized protein LOC109237554 [Nicotiana attenuata]|uniref:uncharacterized protein LOC109237554 n=1 Tax=Nicotiana attenuata TaxID=49451 RepID=UPI000904C247|nr:PREDICTED: uncharacterized protein LOC109237554 [Nicotiana attenuata]